MKIASFNINGVKARLPRLLEWLEETRPTVACLQEVKSQDEGFPAAEFEKTMAFLGCRHVHELDASIFAPQSWRASSPAPRG